MKAFEIIKRVLDAELQNIDAANKEDRIALVNEEVSRLVAAYGKLTDDDASAPDYSSAAARFAYIFKYTTCHADIVSRALQKCGLQAVKRVLEGDGWLRVTCVGGGPGSDFIGVLKYLANSDIRRNLRCFLLDSQAAWGDTWSEVDEQADELKIRVSTHFQELDVRREDTWEKQTKYHGADLYTLIYFLSEIYRSREEAEPFFSNLAAKAKSGAIFLVVDNSSDEFVAYIDDLASTIGLKKLGGLTQKFQLGGDEQKSALGEYLSLIDHSPKLTTAIYYAFFQKV